jgi:hypothetical protein
VRALLTLSDGIALPVTQRVCLAPSVDASRAALFGGGRRAVPGAVSRAHRGLMLLDDLPAFGVKLARLPAILDERVVTLERSGSSLRLPAAFQLVATARPCPCGWFGDTEAICTYLHARLGAPLSAAHPRGPARAHRHRGRLQSSEYTDREGVKRTSVEVVVLRSDHAPLPRRAEPAAPEPEPEPTSPSRWLRPRPWPRRSSCPPTRAGAARPPRDTRTGGAS